ncbi:hypothetical protein GCM10010862_10270 [Devosia nitrariae]|uniref:Uncharacterized protein n=1 Tax=Devosia nitrariae TaxID=2071872 RepID=A0ABQ5W221_9HYPH|nr:hypothetical protein GCM10010862_10270 [Devosia nitrariae]
MEGREAELSRWLRDNAPECFEEQKHLDAGSSERAYWHHGYLMAIRDVLALLDRSSASTKVH